MLLDLKVSFKNEKGETIKYEFGTSYYNAKDKKYSTVEKSHTEILAVKAQVIKLLESLL